MDYETLNKVKQLELKILKYVDNLCKNNDIKYYIVGGTLLGAIRHKGFIPWDDDIDIAMFRHDYNKFLKINYNKKLFFIQNFGTDSNYLRYITKVRLNGTSFVEEYVKDLPMHHGIFIDIFPLDKINSYNEKKIEKRIRMANKFIRLQHIKVGKAKGCNARVTRRNRVLKFILKIIPMSSKLIDYCIDTIYGLDNFEKTNFVTSFSSHYGWKKQTFPINVYGEGIYLEFEGHKFMAPVKWEVILKSIYGDYMELPPKTKRKSGHNVVHVDLGKYK